VGVFVLKRIVTLATSQLRGSSEVVNSVHAR
jgi:hypothetical protein